MGSIRILPISHPFHPTVPQPSSKPSSNLSLSFRTPPTPRAAEDDSTSAGADQEQQAPTNAPASADDPFESRLAQVRFKYRSGTGKKAEQRRQRKGKPGSAGAGVKPRSLMLPPIPLREPTAGGGVKVEVGFTPYSERLNGAVAGIGLAALLLVELGSGKGLLSFHTPAVLFLQLYTVTAFGAVFVKWEKERISVWPDKALVRPDAAATTAGE